VGACYSMRPAHAEIWLRYLNNLNIPLWGFLGYQMTSPLADNSAEINRQFANALATGSTFLNACRPQTRTPAIHRAGPPWCSITPRMTPSPRCAISSAARHPPPRLFPLWAVGRCASHDTTRKAPDPVQINAPPALMVFHQWSFGFWQQMLVTNVDFTQTSFDTAAAKSNGKLVNNSWGVLNSCNSSPWLDPKKQNLTSMSEWNQALCPNQTYRFSVFPPFNSNFQNGYQDGDTIELSMVHGSRGELSMLVLVVVFAAQGGAAQAADAAAPATPAAEPRAASASATPESVQLGQGVVLRLAGQATLYVVGLHGGIDALEVLNGKQRWHSSAAAFPLFTRAGELLAIGTRPAPGGAHRLVVLDAETGKQGGELPPLPAEALVGETSTSRGEIEVQSRGGRDLLVWTAERLPPGVSPPPPGRQGAGPRHPRGRGGRSLVP